SGKFQTPNSKSQQPPNYRRFFFPDFRAAFFAAFFAGGFFSSTAGADSGTGAGTGTASTGAGMGAGGLGAGTSEAGAAAGVRARTPAGGRKSLVTPATAGTARKASGRGSRDGPRASDWRPYRHPGGRREAGEKGERPADAPGQPARERRETGERTEFDEGVGPHENLGRGRHRRAEDFPPHRGQGIGPGDLDRGYEHPPV